MICRDVDVAQEPDVWVYTTCRPCKVSFDDEYLKACGKPLSWRPSYGLLEPAHGRAAAKLYYKCGHGIGFFIAPKKVRPYVKTRVTKEGYGTIELDRPAYLLSRIDRLFKLGRSVTAEEYDECLQESLFTRTERHVCPPLHTRTILVPRVNSRRSLESGDNTSEMFHLEMD